jgi:hypothetical protein
MVKAAFNKMKTPFYQQIELQFKQETVWMLYLEHNFVKYWHLHTTKSRPEIPGKILSVVM